jgi:hypothetical protein
MNRRFLAALAGAPLAALLTTSPAVADADAALACKDLGGTVQADSNCHLHSETATYRLDLSYPISYPDQLQLRDFITQNRADFVDFMTKVRPRDWPFEHGATPKTFSSADTRSVVFEIYDDTGAHPVTGFKAFNHDLNTRAPITYDTLFRSGVDPVTVLDPIVQRVMDERWRGNGGPAPRNTLGAKVYENFAITDDAVVFFIPQGMWLPEVAGPIEVPVARSALGALTV